MSAARSACLVAALLASGCSVSPLVGVYEGPGRPANVEPRGGWNAAKLDLRADGAAWWCPAFELEGSASILTFQSRWRVDTPAAGVEVITVLPSENDRSPRKRFDVITVAGETVLVAEDGVRLTRVR